MSLSPSGRVAEVYYQFSDPVDLERHLKKADDLPFAAKIACGLEPRQEGPREAQEHILKSLTREFAGWDLARAELEGRVRTVGDEIFTSTKMAYYRDGRDADAVHFAKKLFSLLSSASQQHEIELIAGGEESSFLSIEESGGSDISSIEPLTTSESLTASIRRE